jgi:putative ABC transport system permease protein
MLGTAEGYQRSFGQLFENRGADLIVTQAGHAQRIKSSLNEKLGTRLAQIPGVKWVEPVLVDMVVLEENEMDLSGVYVFGLRSDSIAIGQMRVLAGRKLEPTDQRQAVLGNMLAQTLGKTVGDEIAILGVRFEIVGIYQSYNMLEANGAVVPLRELQEVMSPGSHRVTTFLIVLDEAPDQGKAVERVARQIEEMPLEGDSKLSVLSTRDHVKSTFELQVLSGLAWASSTLMLFIGIVSMLNTMMMSVSERVRELATLRALGWKKSRVLRMILLEALILASIGAAVGVLVAWPVMGLLANHRLTGIVVVTQITVEILAKGVGLGILAGLLGAFYPAFIATQLSPVLALRHE